MPLRLRSAGGGSVLLSSPAAQSTDVAMEVPAYDGAKLLTTKTPGSVLQVVSVTKTDTFSVSASDFVDVTGLSVSITPTSATSKILVMAHVHVDSTVGGYTNPWRLVRNSTPICVGDVNSSGRQATGGGTSVYSTGPLQGVHQGVQHLDSPATTSTTTYKVQLATYTNSSGVSYINRGYNDDGGIQNARYASGITVMEIAA